MAGGFHIASGLVDRKASGIELIEWARQCWSGEGAFLPVAIVKLADWIMADPTHRPRMVEACGIGLGELLCDKLKATPELALALYNLTGGSIHLVDWTVAHSDAVISHDQAAVSPGDGGDRVAPLDPSSPLNPDVHPIVIHGTLGATAIGKLFRVVRGPGRNCFVLTGLGVALALDRGAAMDALEELATALNVTISAPERRA